MFKCRIIVSIIILWSLTQAVFAEEVVTTIDTRTGKMKQIKLKKTTLSPQTRSLIRATLNHDTYSPIDFFAVPFFSSTSNFPAAYSLGMNNVPVLDQGQNGTCATFATTAAIDAVLNRGDYISQLCFLQLTRSLQNDKLSSISGWEGGFEFATITLLNQYGVVSKEYEHTIGCNGVHNYNLSGNNTFLAMSAAEYTKNSMMLSDVLSYQSTVYTLNDRSAVLTLKKAIANHHRVVIGATVLLQNGHALLTTYKANNDTFVASIQNLTDLLSNHIPSGGHAMVVTGYDDNAVVYDDHTIPHQGVLILRNSWGSDTGDHGDFYMSYDYANIFTHALTEIIPK